MNREDALKKIKKCLALSRSANEHEAAVALRQAQHLMREHGLREQDVSLADGHHNLAAAKLAGVEPTWRGPSRKLQRVMQSMGPARSAEMLINNLTDSDWYYVDSGEIVTELLGIERMAA